MKNIDNIIDGLVHNCKQVCLWHKVSDKMYLADCYCQNIWFDENGKFSETQSEQFKYGRIGGREYADKNYYKYLHDIKINIKEISKLIGAKCIESECQGNSLYIKKNDRTIRFSDHDEIRPVKKCAGYFYFNSFSERDVKEFKEAIDELMEDD